MNRLLLALCLLATATATAFARTPRQGVLARGLTTFSAEAERKFHDPNVELVRKGKKLTILAHRMTSDNKVLFTDQYPVQKTFIIPKTGQKVLVVRRPAREGGTPYPFLFIKEGKGARLEEMTFVGSDGVGKPATAAERAQVLKSARYRLVDPERQDGKYTLDSIGVYARTAKGLLRNNRDVYLSMGDLLVQMGSPNDLGRSR